MPSRCHKLLVAVPFLLLISAGTAWAADEPRPYDNFKVVTIEALSAKQLMAVSQIGENLACQAGPGPQRFLIPADAMGALDDLGVTYRIDADDAQAVLDLAREENTQAQLESAARGANAYFTAYQTYQNVGASTVSINSYLDTLVALNPSIATRFTLPNATIQGRPLYGIRINGPTDGIQDPVFVITAGQHAREWIAPATAMFTVDQLIRNYGIDSEVTSFVNNVEWYIIPSVNPDGYTYTFPVSQGGNNTRLWRKNRRANPNGSFGVDLNRNWSVGWGLNGGSSSNQNNDTYRGTAPFSEPETTAIRNWANTLPAIKGHIDFHSYSQLVLSPWGYTLSPSPRVNELAPLTSAMISSITNTFGVEYTGGPAGSTLYIASGVIPDWFFDQKGALSWTIELRDTGNNGFVLPPSQIVPNGIEAFNGVKVLARAIQQRMTITPNSPPTTLTPNAPSSFGVAIAMANTYTLQAGSAALRYRVGNAGPYSTAPLTGGPANFTATVPPTPCGQVVEYYVQATANDGHVTVSPAAAPGTVLTAQVGACPVCPGDLTGDGQVTTSDLTVLLGNFGLSVPAGTAGDLNGDGQVTTTDLTTLLAAFGTSCI